jgi:(2Fe-2S) ferredoxin
MLIRRPGRQSSSVCQLRSWCVVDPAAPEGHRVTWGAWSYPTELFAAVERAEELESWERTGDGGQPQTGTPAGADEPLLLVCTNGRKDVCCAVRGRPVALGLAARFPEQTWECTHTGGDRFAANVLLLPDGAIYGGLDTDSALEAVQAHRDGRPGAVQQHLRGLIGHPRPVQAALVGALLELGLAWGQVRPGPVVGTTARLSEEEVQAREQELAADGTEVARWRIDVDVIDGPRVVAEVSEHLRPATALTCKAVERPTHSRVPVFEGLTPRA